MGMGEPNLDGIDANVRRWYDHFAQDLLWKKGVDSHKEIMKLLLTFADNQILEAEEWADSSCDDTPYWKEFKKRCLTNIDIIREGKINDILKK